MHNILCDLLTIGGLNTLLFYNPYAKLCFTSTITSYFKKTTYLDFDTTYTAYTKSNLINKCLVIIVHKVNITFPVQPQKTTSCFS